MLKRYIETLTKLNTMKLTSKILFLIGLPVALLVSSCGPSHYYGPGDSGDDEMPSYASSPGMVTDLKYDKDGAWSECYKVNPPAIMTILNVNYSHYAALDSENNVEWHGFSPSNSTDGLISKYNLWGNPTGHGYYRTPFMMAKWDPNESLDEIPMSPACAIRLTTGVGCNPYCIYVTNACTTLGAVKFGTDTSEPFKNDDYLTLVVNIVRGRERIGTVEQPLVLSGKLPLANWIAVDLREYENIDMIYFQLKSNRKNKEGVIDVPPYFCVDYFMFDI